MILTPKIWARLGALVVLTAVIQVTFFAKIQFLGGTPDGAVLVVMALGLLGGSVSGAVGGFTIGLLIDCLLFQTLGAFAAAYMCVGYVAGRYRESTGLPKRGALPLLGAAMTLVGVLAFAAIQIGTGVDADVSTRIIADTVEKTILGAALSIPVFWVVRLVLRPALVEDRPAGRRPLATGAAGSRGQA